MDGALWIRECFHETIHHTPSDSGSTVHHNNSTRIDFVIVDRYLDDITSPVQTLQVLQYPDTLTLL